MGAFDFIWSVRNCSWIRESPNKAVFHLFIFHLNCFWVSITLANQQVIGLSDSGLGPLNKVLVSSLVMKKNVIESGESH